MANTTHHVDCPDCNGRGGRPDGCVYYDPGTGYSQGWDACTTCDGAGVVPECAACGGPVLEPGSHADECVDCSWVASDWYGTGFGLSDLGGEA